MIWNCLKVEALAIVLLIVQELRSNYLGNWVICEI